MEQTKNTNPDPPFIMIAGDADNVIDGLIANLTNPYNGYQIRATDDLSEIRAINRHRKIGILLVVIIKKEECFKKLISISLDPEFQDTKIVVCTAFTDSKTHKLLNGLNLRGTFGITSTRTETVEIITKVNNGDTMFMLPEDLISKKKINNKRNRNPDGTYRMPELFKEVLNYLQKGKEIPEISGIIHIKLRTVEGWFRPFRIESGTHCQQDDIEWAIEHGYIERVVLNCKEIHYS